VDAVSRQITTMLLVVRIERMRRLVRILLEQRAMKFTYLSAVAGEIDKLGSEMEDDARKVITEDIPAIREHKQNTFGSVKRHLGDARGALTTMDGMLDAIDKATNGPRPTLGNSSPPRVPSVDAKPTETAGLPDRKGG